MPGGDPSLFRSLVSPVQRDVPITTTIPAEDRCVSWGAIRADGTRCRDKAGESGWCDPCLAELAG